MPVEPNMSIDNLISAIYSRAQGRFTLASGSESESARRRANQQQYVCRLKRVSQDAGWRTILIAESDFSDENIQSAYGWAADYREQMLEPETADLYLFLLVKGIPDEEASRIETDDRFCRKFVMRQKESSAEMLDRTFLAMPTTESSTGNFTDPLQTAFAAVAIDHPWTRAHLETWREMLLSGKTGSELAQTLTSTLNTRPEEGQ
jgi:hypothetical protein